MEANGDRELAASERGRRAGRTDTDRRIMGEIAGRFSPRAPRAGSKAVKADVVAAGADARLAGTSSGGGGAVGGVEWGRIDRPRDIGPSPAGPSSRTSKNTSLWANVR